MSKKLIAGSLAVATALGSFAILAAPTFAAQDAWHQVTVTPETELILGGGVSENVELEPTISAIDSAAGAALTVKSSVAWDLDWQAVNGEEGDALKTAAPGTNLGTSGFALSGGYAYAGSQTTAAIGSNNWGVVLASTDLAADPTLTTSLSTIASGSATSSGSVTPTYSAGTDGSLGQNTYYGTIYYTLAAQ
jgi:hypothetical protein